MFEVILVDDNADLLASLKQTIGLAGFKVSAFSAAPSALGTIDNSFSGVILSDIKMQGMDGIALLEEVIRIDSDIPVIMMTGHGDISTAVKSMQLGAYDFLEKPFRGERLVDILYRASEKRKLVLENRQLRSQLDTGAADDVEDSFLLKENDPTGPKISLPERIQRFEKHLIEQTLSRNRGNVKQTYLDLNIPRKTLYDKFARHQIDQKRYR